MADEYRLSAKPTDVFLLRFNEQNKGKSEAVFEKLVKQSLGIEREAYVKLRGEIYSKFTYGCPDIGKAGPHKASKL